MLKTGYIAKVEEFDREKPGFKAALHEWIEKAKELNWISQKLLLDFELRLTREEIVAYLAERRAEARKPGAGAEAAELPPAQPATEGGENRELKPRPQGPVTQAEILAWAQDTRNKLFLEAKENPDSDAETLIKILCLNGLVENKTDLKEADALKLIEAHRRQKELEHKAKEDENRATLAEVAEKNAETKRLKAVQEMELMKARVRAVKSELRKAKQALKEGTRLNPADVYRHISAAIGIGGPLEERVEG